MMGPVGWASSCLIVRGSFVQAKKSEHRWLSLASDPHRAPPPPPPRPNALFTATKMENAAAVAFQSSRLSKYPHFTLFPLSLHLPLPPMLSNRLIRVRAESEENAVSDTTKDATAKSSSGSGTGFGSTPASTFSSSSRREKKKRTREKDSVIRRNPINKSDLFGESQPSDQPQEVNESAFLLTWLGLGSLILIEGIALAAS
ncbi:hypothetical protein ACLOJK_033446, partial [Asimina triloba]